MKEEESRAPAPKKSGRVKKKSEVQRPGLEADYAPFDPAAARTILLVDGYNVINAWSKTIKARSAGYVRRGAGGVKDSLPNC